MATADSVAMVALLQGIMAARPQQCDGNVAAWLTRLWVHEAWREYGDRLACESDVTWLRAKLVQLLVTRFGWQATADDAQLNAGWSLDKPGAAAAAVAGLALGCLQPPFADENLFHGANQLLFGSFGACSEPRGSSSDSSVAVQPAEQAYDVLLPLPRLARLLEEASQRARTGRRRTFTSSRSAKTSARGSALTMRASSSNRCSDGSGSGGDGGAVASDYVFFDDAVLHVVRLARVLRLPGCEYLCANCVPFIEYHANHACITSAT